MEYFSDFRLNKLRKLFGFYDTDGNGIVELADIEEIGYNFISALSLKPNSAEAAHLRNSFKSLWLNLVNAADGNNDEQVTWEEFLEIMRYVLASDLNYERYVRPLIENVFVLIDQNGDNRISAEDFNFFYCMFRHTDLPANLYFRMMDLDKDGYISKQEVTELFRQFHLSDDANSPGNVFFGLLP